MIHDHEKPPEVGAGAEALMRWTLDALRKERKSAEEWLEECEENARYARMCVHEAIQAEREVAELVNGRMFVSGTDRGQAFDVTSLDAEVCLDALIPPASLRRQIEPPPRILSHLGAAWSAIDIERYASGAPTFIFGASNETAKSYVAPREPAPHAKIAEIVKAEAPLPKPPKKAKEDRSVFGNLEALWKVGDVTFDALYARMDHDKYGRRTFENDLRNLGQSGALLRLRFHEGESYVIPPAGAPMPPSSIFGDDGNPIALRKDPVTRVNQPAPLAAPARPSAVSLGEPSEGQPRPSMMTPDEIAAHNARLMTKLKVKPPAEVEKERLRGGMAH